MVYVLANDRQQAPLAGDQHPVQAFAASTGDPAFGYSVRARRLDRCLNDAHADRGEPGAALCSPVPDQEFKAISVTLEVYQQVAGLPGHIPAQHRVLVLEYGSYSA
jgi:hypothetical protein